MTITTLLPPRAAAEGATGGPKSRTGNAPSAGAAAFADALHAAPSGAAAGGAAPTRNDHTTATPGPERGPGPADAARPAETPAQTPSDTPTDTPTDAEAPSGDAGSTPAVAPTVTPAVALPGLAFPGHAGTAFPLPVAGQPAGAESALPTSVPAPTAAPTDAAALAAADGRTLATDLGATTTGSGATALSSAVATGSVVAPTAPPTPRAAAAAASATAASAAAAAVTAAGSSAATPPAVSSGVPSGVPLGVTPVGAGTAHGAGPATVPSVVPSTAAAASAAATPAASSAATSAATSAVPETAAPDPGIITPTPGERGSAAGAWPLGPVAASGSAPAASIAPAPAQATASASTPLASQVVRPLFTLATAGPGEHTLSISVTPDNLGPVVVRAQISAAGMRLELFAPTELARDALRLILPDLRRDLAGGGLPASLDLSTRSQPGEAGFSGRQDRPAPDLSGHGGAGFGGDSRGSQDGSRDPATANPWLRAAAVGLDATGPPGADAAAPTGTGATGRVDVLA